MKKLAIKILTITYVLRSLSMLILFSLAACVNESTEEEQDSDSNASLYRISEDQFKAADIQLVRMQAQDFHLIIQTNGFLDVPPTSRAAVSVYFGGYIKEINLLPGDRVKKGQVLFRLENPEFIEIQQAYLEAKDQLKYLKSNFERQKNLAEENVTSQKTYLKAEADYFVMLSSYEGLKKKLSLMNIPSNTLTANSISTTISVTAPISGYVTSVNATKGQYLNPSDIAIAIIDTEHMHLELSIFEKYLSAIEVGQPIKFHLQDSDEIYDGSVHLINKVVDPEKRTITVHGHMEENERFVPGMYVEADIYAATTSGLALPAEAIVAIDGENYVLVLQDQSDSQRSFIKKHVLTGASSGGFVEILNYEDFEKQAEFVSEGAFNLIRE